VNHFYNVSQTILDLGMENFHPLKFSEMSTTLLSLEHELSTILRDCGISSFVWLMRLEERISTDINSWKNSLHIQYLLFLIIFLTQERVLWKLNFVKVFLKTTTTIRWGQWSTETTTNKNENNKYRDENYTCSSSSKW
jgi:hypothetical protein